VREISVFNAVAILAAWAVLSILPVEGASSDASRKLLQREGSRIAKVWCANCHVVADGQSVPAQSDAPSFAELAAKEDQSETKLQGFLLTPRHPMPPLNLSRAEMDAVIAYILSLKP